MIFTVYLAIWQFLSLKVSLFLRGTSSYDKLNSAGVSMNRLTSLLVSRMAHMLSGLFLALLYGIFAYVHLLSFFKTQQITMILFCFSETLLVFFYIFRSKPVTISVNGFDWMVAIIGTFAPLFFRPTDWGLLPLAKYAIIVGVIAQILGLISLNHSFALVAAKRKIKTGWMYRFIRHPIYASYCLSLLGYVLTNTSLTNVVVYLVSMVFLCIRMVREEKHLMLDPIYIEYMSKVRYRLIPYIV